MSCVADRNAMIQNTANVPVKKKGAGSMNATAAMATPNSSCIPTIQVRLVLKMSTNGLQKGLMTQGR